MRVVGPQTLTVGQANVINDPAQAGGNPSVACQIQNSSPYQLNVLAAGDELSIQPFTAQTVEISGQPIQVFPIAGTSTQACIVTICFLLTVTANQGVQLPDGTWVESPPQQDGPLTAAAIASALSTQGSVDPLAVVAAGPVFVGGVTQNFEFTALHSYSSLLVVLENPNIITALTAQAWSGPSVSATRIFVPQTQTPTPQIAVGAGTQVVFLLPLACSAGDNVAVAIQAAANVTFNNYSIYGLTQTLTVQVYAPPGNPLSTAPRGGVFKVNANPAANTDVVLLAAAIAGFAWRLHRFSCADVSGAGAAGDQILLYDGTATFFDVLNPTNPSHDLAGLTTTTAVHAFNSAGAAMRMTLAYDAIPTPAVA